MERIRIVSIRKDHYFVLFKNKIKLFFRLRSYLDVFITLLYVVAWLVLGAYTPAPIKYLYVFPYDGWRIFLWVRKFFNCFESLIAQIDF